MPKPARALPARRRRGAQHEPVAPHVADRVDHQCRGGLRARHCHQFVVFAWFLLHASFSENLAIGALFTGISLLRSYALRRLFEHCR